MPKMENVYLISLSGEITYRTKGGRRLFTGQTVRNLRTAVEATGKHIQIRHIGGKFEARGDFTPEVCERIFGIKTCLVARRMRFDGLEELARAGELLWCERVAGKTFGVRCKRVGTHDFSSQDVGVVLGGRLNPYAAGVDLTAPDVWVDVEIRGKTAYFVEQRIEGPAGLPIGAGDEVLVLFSGGYDSPVATWHLAKRGAVPHFVHFAFGGLGEVESVIRVAQYLRSQWLIGAAPTFVVVPFADVVRAILEVVESSMRQVTLRRAMYQAAELVARDLGCEVLVTGEALAQATSQTLRNLRAEQEGIALPILRPLISYDKEEIIQQAEKIGTRELSSQVNELCSIAQGPVSPRVALGRFYDVYRRIDPDVIHSTVEQAITVDLSAPVDALDELLRDETPTIAYIPGDAVVVNVMPNAAPLSDAIPLSEFHEDEYSGNDTPLIFVCRHGLTSGGLARAFRQRGYNAYSLEGGYERYRRQAKEGGR